MQVLCFETPTTLREISQFVRVVAHKMYQVAIQNELEITGPVYWIYTGMDGNPETVFTLCIALPVSNHDTALDTSDFKLKQLETFHCVAEQHPGNWNQLGETYGSLIPGIISDGLVMSGQNREIYLHMDFDNPEANITEVQIGITEQ